MIDEAILSRLLAPSFPRWLAAQRAADRMLRSCADEGKIHAAMDKARRLEVRAIAEIRSAACKSDDPRQLYLFYFDGRVFLVLPDGNDVEVDGQLTDQIVAIDPARIVGG